MTKKLNANKIKEYWSKTYNDQGKPDWSHIFPFYHEDIVFQDSIQIVEGKQAFMDMCERLASRCEQLVMDIETVVMKGEEAFFQWKMVMKFKRFPSTPMFGTTKLTFGEDDRIIHQRDYFDLWGDIFNGIPWFRNLYRRFMRNYFG